MTTAFAMSVIMFLLAGFVKIDTRGTGIAAATLIFLYQSCYTWGWVSFPIHTCSRQSQNQITDPLDGRGMAHVYRNTLDRI